MALIRWDPFREMESMKESWSPSVDIYETENEIVLKAELPGMLAKDIEIKLENNVLMLKGERRFEKETNKDNYHRVEMSYGNFSRSFSSSRRMLRIYNLPAFVDENKVRAEYKDGLLKVFLPKKEQAKSKLIEIRAA